MKTWKQLKVMAIIAIIGIIIGFMACDQDNGTTHVHQWGEWTVANPATCTTAGVETRACVLDVTHTETRTATALGHDYQNWTQITAPTCTEAGIETGTCSHDASTTTRTILTLGHTPDTKTGICTVCDSLAYNIGDTGPGGGIIFYVAPAAFTLYMDATDTTGTTAHYLEVASNDLINDRIKDMGFPDYYPPTYFKWSSSGYIYIPNMSDIVFPFPDNIEEIDIGTGRKNTALILITDPSAPAAKACTDYNGNDKDDWFLPSIGELKLLHMSSVINPENNNFDDFFSSSQNCDLYAWTLNFHYPVSYYYTNPSWIINVQGKHGPGKARPVRAF